MVLRTVMGAEVSDGIHLKESPAAVQVKVTVSIGHGLSTLTEYCALQNAVFNVSKSSYN